MSCAIVWFVVVWFGFGFLLYVAWAGLALLSSASLASLNAGITGVSHHKSCQSPLTSAFDLERVPLRTVQAC